ncbi:MAG: hypothetical protein K0R41_2232, partial [Geminicoccaceae bacterium]|nr:hypothetical protein [Geminicoccaceae bacterium]
YRNSFLIAPCAWQGASAVAKPLATADWLKS